jgi:hypothetical protein
LLFCLGSPQTMILSSHVAESTSVSHTTCLFMKVLSSIFTLCVASMIAPCYHTVCQNCSHCGGCSEQHKVFALWKLHSSGKRKVINIEITGWHQC